MCWYRLIESWECLKLLDVSGNAGLANEGCLKLLQHCRHREDLKIDLRSCGMSSPLPGELRELISELAAKKKVEILGNDIDSTDYALIFPGRGHVCNHDS